MSQAIDDLNFKSEDVLYTDTCSVKSSVLEDIKKRKSEFLAKFVLSHPIAGSEKSGISASSSNLFDNKLTIVCPHENNAEEDINKVEGFWQNLGSLTKRLPANNHDDLFAKTSHLPHVISFALMHFLEKELGDKVFKYSGGSLESYTRIASSDPLMWKDVTVSNKEAVLEAIKGFKSSLNEVSKLIDSEDEESILDYLRFVKDVRDKRLEEDS
jgi:prephenate dehydrogenase